MVEFARPILYFSKASCTSLVHSIGVRSLAIFPKEKRVLYPVEW